MKEGQIGLGHFLWPIPTGGGTSRRWMVRALVLAEVRPAATFERAHRRAVERLGAAKTRLGSGREAGEGARGGEETLGGLGMGEMGGASKGDGGRSGVPQGEIVSGVGGTGEAETERVRGSRCFALGAQMSHP